MISSVLALFGASSRGQVEKAYYCTELTHLFEQLGEPPQDSQGLFFAIQSLLYGQPVIYFRVLEEGVSVDDYLFGLTMLRDPNWPLRDIRALFLPGVGSKEILEEGVKLCSDRHSLLLMSETDFYDFLTN